MTIRTVVWNEFVHERENRVVRDIYPEGIHVTIAAALASHVLLRLATALAWL